MHFLGEFDTSAHGSHSFIGPIPEGWLKSHRKQWYKHHLHINYHSRAATFSAGDTISRLRKLSGLEGPSLSAIYTPSFPQPDDVDTEDDDDPKTDDENEIAGGANGTATEEVTTTNAPPAIAIPRYTNANPDTVDDGDQIFISDHNDPHVTTPKRKPSILSKSVSSFHTANESFGGGDGASERTIRPRKQTPCHRCLFFKTDNFHHLDLEDVAEGVERRSVSLDSDVSADAEAANSRSSLLPRGSGTQSSSALRAHQDQGTPSPRKETRKNPTEAIKSTNVPGNDPSLVAEPATAQQGGRAATGLVRFHIPDAAQSSHPGKAGLAQSGRRRSLRRGRRSNKRDGEIVKMEKMLVKVESTVQDLSNQYDENESMVVDTKTVEKWQEFVVVCRESASDEADYVLQLYKTRVSVICIYRIAHSTLSYCYLLLVAPP